MLSRTGRIWAVIALAWLGVLLAIWNYLSLPIVYATVENVRICAIDPNSGHKIPLESVGSRYHYRYVEKCPKGAE